VAAGKAPSAEFERAWSSLLLMVNVDRRLFTRAVHYQRDGRVEMVDVSESLTVAIVRGTIPYLVTISVEGSTRVWSCACPAGEGGAICKHVVACALAVNPPSEQLEAQPDGSPETEHPASPADEIEVIVNRLDRDDLVEVLIAHARVDWRLREQLLARSAAATKTPIDESVWRAKINNAYDSHGDYVDYGEASSWADGIDDVLTAVGELIETHPAQAATLLEYAYDLANESIDRVDDSDGQLSDIATHIGDLHLSACEAARIDPVLLAHRLVELELNGELDAFDRAAEKYVGVLGSTGLAEYRRLIESKWKTETSTDDASDVVAYRLRAAMTGIAVASGSPDELIRVLSRSPIGADGYLEIVESLSRAQRPAEAIEWGQRGLIECGVSSAYLGPLREAVAALLRSSGEVQQAVALFDEAFRYSPSLSSFRRLVSESALLDASDATKRDAIAFVRVHVAQAPANPHSYRQPSDVLVEILMYEGDIEGAWNAAGEYPCGDQWWLQLAAARQATHPLDSISIYTRAALSSIEGKNNGAYESAVTYMAKIRQLASAAGAPALFTTLLAEVRSAHKPKRNLMTMLIKKGW
jgi:uncharacterized Zn finger protein